MIEHNYNVLRAWVSQQRDNVTMRRIDSGDWVVFNWSSHKLVVRGSLDECAAAIEAKP